MTSLPHDVLSAIYSKADPMTKARMRATSKRMYTNRLMPAPLAQGYAFGTGKYQKAYNELPKKIMWFVDAQLSVADHFNQLPQLEWLKGLIGFAMKAYKNAVKAKKMSISTQFPRELRHMGQTHADTVHYLRILFPGASTYAPLAAFNHPHRERFMDAVLKLALQKYRNFEEGPLEHILDESNAYVNNAAVTEWSQSMRESMKEEKLRELARRSQYQTPANKAAARVVRRAARRIAA